MKSPDDKIKEEVMTARIDLIAALVETGIYSDEWILKLFGTDHLDVGDTWPT